MRLATAEINMGRKKKKKTNDEKEVTSETVRIDIELMMLMRDVCRRTVDSRGRQMKLTTLLHELLGPVIRKRHRDTLRQEDGQQ